ncbi:MAG: hypothetical protein DRH97_00245 [Chloroflexi bacterium]|nr:MAG: hypothetical protein DRH97_00245 [Chloroflexota bacterium]
MSLTPPLPRLVERGHVHCNQYDGCLIVGAKKCIYDRHPVPPPIKTINEDKNISRKFQSEHHRKRWEKELGIESKTYHSANTISDYQLQFERRLTWGEFLFKWLFLAAIILFAIYAVEWLGI